MSSFAAAPADRGRKRRADEELDAPAPKMTRNENQDEKNRLKSNLEEVISRDSLLSLVLSELDKVVAVAFCNTETQLQREDAEQLAVYLKNRFPDMCELSAVLIIDLHRSFHKCKSDAVLPHNRLPLFLKLSHQRAQATEGPCHIDSLVKNVLHDIQSCNETTTFTTWVTSKGDKSERIASLFRILGTIYPRLREADDHAESVATLQRQQGPSRTVTVVIDFTDDCMELSDIHDIDLRRKTEKLSTLFADKPVSVLYEAITKKNGSFGDACEYLTEPIPAELDGDSERGPVEEPKQELKEESREELKEKPV